MSEEQQILLTAIDTLVSSNKESHEAIKNTLAEGIKGLQIKIEADALIMSRVILDMQKENGEQLKESNLEIEEVKRILNIHSGKMIIYDKHFRFLNVVKKKWYFTALVFIAVFVGLNFLYDIGWLQKAVDFLIKKI